MKSPKHRLFTLYDHTPGKDCYCKPFPCPEKVCTGRMHRCIDAIPDEAVWDECDTCDEGFETVMRGGRQ